MTRLWMPSARLPLASCLVTQSFMMYVCVLVSVFYFDAPFIWYLVFMCQKIVVDSRMALALGDIPFQLITRSWSVHVPPVGPLRLLFTYLLRAYLIQGSIVASGNFFFHADDFAAAT